MPQLLADAWVFWAIGLAVAVVAAAGLVWVARSPAAMDDPLVATAVAFAIIVLAIVLAPIYSVLLLIVLPVVLLGLALYFLLRRRASA